MDAVGLFLSTAFTIFTVSLIFKETPLYRFAQHVFMGSAMGYGIVMAVKSISDIAWTPMTKGEFLWIMPLLLGLMLYTKFSKKYFWLSRYPTAILVATGVTLTMRSVVRSSFLAQISSTFLNPIGPPYVGYPQLAINNMLVIVIVVCTVVYFIFSGERTVQRSPVLLYLRKAAMYFMMFAFGAGFANTVVSRIALWVGRTRYLLASDARVFTLVIIVFTALILAGHDRLGKMWKGRR
jgi:hypothetical protein